MTRPCGPIEHSSRPVTVASAGTKRGRCAHRPRWPRLGRPPRAMPPASATRRPWRCRDPRYAAARGAVPPRFGGASPGHRATSPGPRGHGPCDQAAAEHGNGVLARPCPGFRTRGEVCARPDLAPTRKSVQAVGTPQRVAPPWAPQAQSVRARGRRQRDHPVPSSLPRVTAARCRDSPPFPLAGASSSRRILRKASNTWICARPAEQPRLAPMAS